ncbi:MAG: GAF domain-containing protein [Alphaproteobacteria bacterium]|nr:GAF domain-containing protein [Alphaproteobacteria bacterium]
MATLISLCQNAALLALGVLAYSFARPRMEPWPALLRAAVSGALFAALTLLSMLTPLAVTNGFMLDARNTLVALATVFAGPIAGAMAALPAAIYRLELGGAGALPSLYALASAVLLGAALRIWAARRGRPVGLTALTVLGAGLSLALVSSLYIFYDEAARSLVLAGPMLPYALSIMLGLPALGMLVLLGDRQHALQGAIERSDLVLRQSQNAVVGILKDELLAGRGLERQLRAITRTAAEVLRLDLVTIWRYDETLPVARCLERWDGRPPHHGFVPRASVPDTRYDDLPDVRAALTGDLTHRAVDARTDPVTGPLVNEAYPGPEPISMLYSGIRHADRLVGHVALGTYGRRRDWTIEEETFARSIADLVGLALLQDQIDRRETTLRRNLALLVQLVRDELLRGAPIEETLRSITQSIGESLDVERTSIWRLDLKASAYHCLELWDKSERRHIGASLPVAAIGAQVTGLLQREFVMVIDDVGHDPRLAAGHRQFLRSLGVQSAMLVQIGLPTEPFGLLVFSATTPRVWTLDDQAVARSIADLISLAVLKDELDRRERALRGNQALVIEIVRDDLLRTAPLADILRSMTERVGTALAVDRTSVWQLDDDVQAIRCLARWDNVDRRHTPGGWVDLIESAPLFEQLKREIVVEVENFGQDGRVPPTAIALLGTTTVPKSALIALIGAPDRPFGVVAFASETVHDWTLEQQTLIRSLSHLIGFAFLSQSYREAIAALDLVGEGIYVQGPAAEIIYANRTARDLGLAETALPGALDAPDGTSELAWTTPAGATRDLAVSRRHLPDGGVVTMLSDVTELKARQRRDEQLEEQLRQSTKMEAIGRLAGGIAHDFNNMIGAILGFATFLSEDLPAGSSQQVFAKRITEVCTRSREVVKQLLSFSRPSDADRKIIDLRDAVADNAALLRAALPSSTQFTIDPGPAPLPVLVNAAQIYQVLLNLCANANDALEGGGSIAVRLGLVDRDHIDRRVFEGGARAFEAAMAIGGRLEGDRSYAVLRVTDSGSGMDQETIDRVFEPFFTTKPRGRGTGLGLAVVHGIVNAYHGAYLMQSRVGVGTDFAIYLPLADAPGAAEAPPHEAAPSGESVLVVDDDVDFADMQSIALERLGYEVTCCNDPLEALDAFEQDPAAWDVIVSDHMMPGMKGLELVRRLRAVRPDCVTVLCTGFADDVSEASALAAGVDLFVLKPAEPRHIAERVRELLDRRATAALATA